MLIYFIGHNFSSTLDNITSSDIGLQFVNIVLYLPLCSGMPSSNFIKEGTSSVLNDLLKIISNGISKECLSFLIGYY